MIEGAGHRPLSGAPVNPSTFEIDSDHAAGFLPRERATEMIGLGQDKSG